MAKPTRLNGFSLSEMLFVIIIIGILVLIAMPNQSNVITKAKAVEAQMQLGHLHALQKAHFWSQSSYSNSLAEIGFEQESLANEGGSANYRIEIVEAGPQSYRARAIAVIDFDQDGQLNTWEINEKKQLTETVKD